MSNLVWFRNDLRVQDNNSLMKASRNSEKVIAVYCVDPRQFESTAYGFKKTEKFRAKFLLETIAELKSNLEQLNISLFVFYDSPINAIPKLVSDEGIQTIFCQKEWTQEESDDNKLIKNTIPNINWIETYDQFLFHPDDIPYSDFNSIPEIFTVFRKELEKSSKVKSIVKIETKPFHNLVENSTIIPDLKQLGFDDFQIHPKSAFPFKGGENQAWARIESYFWKDQKLSSYKKTRNGLIGLDYSSKLSAWLANGSISARTIYWQIIKYEKEIIKNEDTYWLIFELMWRDYFKYISQKHANKLFKVGGILNAKYNWNNNEKAFRQWENGTSPEHFVNANMIELQQTGWMSNRGRQNVASYWAKEWEQDWRKGAAYFESMLIDYDVHSNYGNWIYNSGVGNDPRDRKFNIKRQAEMYDPKSEFQKIWLNSKLL